MNTGAKQNNEEIYRYEGLYPGSVIQAAVDVITDFFDGGATSGTGKRLSAAAIELIQNIGFYSDEKTVLDGELTGIGSCLISQMNGAFLIETKNRITPEKFKKFVQWIDKLNSMTRDELKQLRRELLKNGAPSGSRGANIGLLDIICRGAIVTVSVEESVGLTCLITKVKITEEQNG